MDSPEVLLQEEVIASGIQKMHELLDVDWDLDDFPTDAQIELDTRREETLHLRTLDFDTTKEFELDATSKKPENTGRTYEYDPLLLVKDEDASLEDRLKAFIIANGKNDGEKRSQERLIRAGKVLAYAFAHSYHDEFPEGQWPVELRGLMLFELPKPQRLRTIGRYIRGLFDHSTEPY